MVSVKAFDSHGTRPYCMQEKAKEWSGVGWGGGRREAEIREKIAPDEEMRQFSFTLSKIPAHLFQGP